MDCLQTKGLQGGPKWSGNLKERLCMFMPLRCMKKYEGFSFPVFFFLTLGFRLHQSFGDLSRRKLVFLYCSLKMLFLSFKRLLQFWTWLESFINCSYNADTNKVLIGKTGYMS